MGSCTTRKRLGITIGSTFGLVFVLVNSGSQPSTLALGLRIVGVLVYLGVMAAVLRGRAAAVLAESSMPRFSRGYWSVVAAEVVLGLAGVQVLAQVFDAPEAGVARITFVVGLTSWRSASSGASPASMASASA